MDKKEPLHADVKLLLEAAQFLIENATHGGELYFQYKPGSQGKLDTKLYGFTSGKLSSN